MQTRILLAVGLLSLNGLAWGQGCPQGMPSAGNPMCVPPDPNNPNAPNYRGNQVPTAPMMPQVRWADQWGAVAIDGTTSDVGAVTGISSKRKAEKAAMARCRAKGGGGCRVQLSYGNQCGVIAWGDDGYSTAGGTTIGKASEVAVRLCSQHYKNCRIYYAACSLPQRIQ